MPEILWKCSECGYVYKDQSLERRKQVFYNSLKQYVKEYGPKMVRSFYDYWSESDRAPKPKMKFEKEKTWETKKRLITWSKKDYNKEYGIEDKKDSKIQAMSERYYDLKNVKKNGKYVFDNDAAAFAWMQNNDKYRKEFIIELAKKLKEKIELTGKFSDEMITAIWG